LEASEAGTPSLVEELAGSPEGKDEHDISESPVLHLYLNTDGVGGWWVGWILFGWLDFLEGVKVEEVAETREAEIEELLLECLKVWF